MHRKDFRPDIIQRLIRDYHFKEENGYLRYLFPFSKTGRYHQKTFIRNAFRKIYRTSQRKSHEARWTTKEASKTMNTSDKPHNKISVQKILY